MLADAGLATAPNNRSTGRGRDAARDVSELSFHSLRHSFVSTLKATGANEAVSQNYTTLDDATLRAAISALPDVTGRAK